MRKLFLICAFSLCLWSCEKRSVDNGLSGQTRPEYIEAVDGSTNKAIDNLQVPLDGIKDGTLHIMSNVPMDQLTWKYFMSQDVAYRTWFTIKDAREVEPGHLVITYDAESLLELNSLEKRESKLSFHCESLLLGKFLNVTQGYSQQFFDTFDSQDGGNLTLADKATYTSSAHNLSADYYDYISFNAWAEAEDIGHLSKNITLDVTVDGGEFFDNGRKTFRVNVPVGTQAEKTNLKYLLLHNGGERMGTKTKFTFSVENDDLVKVHVDNFGCYKVMPAELVDIYEDEEFHDEGEDWE